MRPIARGAIHFSPPYLFRVNGPRNFSRRISRISSKLIPIPNPAYLRMISTSRRFIRTHFYALQMLLIDVDYFPPSIDCPKRFYKSHLSISENSRSSVLSFFSSSSFIFCLMTIVLGNRLFLFDFFPSPMVVLG